MGTKSDEQNHLNICSVNHSVVNKLSQGSVATCIR